MSPSMSASRMRSNEREPAMTYCVALRLDRGLVFAADTRTSAGTANVAQYRKLHYWRKTGDRVIVLASAGNLSVTQSVVSLLNEQLVQEPPEKATEKPGETQATLLTVASLYRAARLVGTALVGTLRFLGGELADRRTIAVDGSLWGGYPGFELLVRETIVELLGGAAMRCARCAGSTVNRSRIPARASMPPSSSADRSAPRCPACSSSIPRATS